MFGMIQFFKRIFGKGSKEPNPNQEKSYSGIESVDASNAALEAILQQDYDEYIKTINRQNEVQ